MLDTMTAHICSGVQRAPIWLEMGTSLLFHTLILLKRTQHNVCSSTLSGSIVYLNGQEYEMFLSTVSVNWNRSEAHIHRWAPAVLPPGHWAVPSNCRFFLWGLGSVAITGRDDFMNLLYMVVCHTNFKTEYAKHSIAGKFKSSDTFNQRIVNVYILN